MSIPHQKIGSSQLRCSKLAYGCWRIAGTWNPTEVTTENIANGKKAILTAIDAGYTLFDHADIYCRGAAEKIFGEVLRENPSLRKEMVIATKCGIRPANTPSVGAPGRYDFSPSYILQSCDDSLKRLNIETIDLYQLHRPDVLMNPEDVASAFSTLQAQGKVREFGVSNFKPSQIQLLQRACTMKLQVNQIEISLAHLQPFEDGTLDQCLELHVTPMAWSPLGGGHLGGGAQRVLPWQETYPSEPVTKALDELSAQLGTDRSTLALAWLLKHPAGIVPIIGSVQPSRIRAAAKAGDVILSREDYYRLYIAARGEPMP